MERAIDGGGLMIAFGDLADRDEPGLAVGRTVADALSGEGFAIVWDGTLDQRIFLPDLDWKRRVRLVESANEAPGKRWWQVWR